MNIYELDTNPNQEPASIQASDIVWTDDDIDALLIVLDHRRKIHVDNFECDRAQLGAELDRLAAVDVADTRSVVAENRRNGKWTYPPQPEFPQFTLAAKAAGIATQILSAVVSPRRSS